MKTIIKIITIRILLIICVSNISFAQQKKINPGERQSQLSYEIPPEKSFVPQREISVEEKNLTEQLMQAKQSGNGKEMLRIQKELDYYQGSVTKQEPPAGKTERMYGRLPAGQNITQTKVLDGQAVKAITLQREQIGSSNRMWAVIAQSQNSSQADTIYILFSDDDGNNWNYFSKNYFSNRYIRLDEIDAEIVQTSTEKFLYIICAIHNFTTGKDHIGLIVNTITGITDGTFIYLYWPGEAPASNSTRKYRPRITSDCALYQYNAAWIYIVCSQDSAISGGYRTYEKTARINYPYEEFPYVTYKSEPFYWNTFSSTTPDSYCDLAFYNDDEIGPSIMVVESNIPTITNLYLMTSSLFNFTSSASSVGSLNGGTSLQKTHGYISSNGYYTNLMITDNERYSGSDHDIQYFTTTNNGVNWTNGYVDYTANFSERADIMERKNIPGEFYLAYSDGGIGDLNVHYCKAVGNVWGTVVPQMNQIDASGWVFPRPCYLTNGPDSCFVIWSQFPNNNTWVSSGCSGSIGVNKNLQLNLFIQGRYNENTNSMAGDTVNVELRNNFAPYALVNSARKFVDASGNGSFNFLSAVNSTNYYLVVKHRNSIETWSKSPGQSFSSDLLNYDFSSTGSQAYGSNLTVVDFIPYRFGIYTGDVNQDGTVDLSDLSLIDNDVYNFTPGYVKTDLTGDNYVDLADLLIADNNAFSFVSKVTP